MAERDDDYPSPARPAAAKSRKKTVAATPMDRIASRKCMSEFVNLSDKTLLKQDGTGV